MQADILREKFLDFFKSKKHKIVESDSLVPAGDPTVLFTPAGMNQFKKEFLGRGLELKRAATAQRCLRTDDLDKVGKTTSHHTFFEMLGNFSFGDYFKEEAIGWAWEFLTEELKISPKRLWVSVYQDDIEAYKIWKDKIGLSQDKIKKLGDKENFWPSLALAKGPNGPCGPCSEIFFDQVEVWNLVFTQYNRREGGILEPLPKKNIDTGMGLERLAALMQGAPNNFQTDLFQPIIKEIEAKVGLNPKNELLYAVADHLRAIVFAIYDGALPSNEARGYVVRKLIRRCRMHLWTLGIEKPFLYTLVPVVAQIMKSPYPQLIKRQENISDIILAEEKSFIATFKSSDSLFKEKFSGILNKPNSEEIGKITFQLYDTYGIPLELTQDWLKKNNLEFSYQAFNRELEAQKSRSKMQSAMKGDVFDIQDPGLSVKETEFLGYQGCQARAKVIKIIRDNNEVKKISKGDEAIIVLDKTVFYAEAGGQVGDSGQLIKGKNIFEVLDTKKLGQAIIHIGRVKAGNFKKSDILSARVDIERRMNIARNHTATHLLQAALRKVLGVHVQQQGSLVAADRLRFDFTHFKDLDKAELDRIEELVNENIINNYPVTVRQHTLAEAKKSGALAFFGEKYSGKVRVISINDISQELCAGTHLKSTGSIGIFKIIQEGSVASGIRRIEAATGSFAYKIIKGGQEALSDISAALKVAPEKVSSELAKRLSRIKELEKQLAGRKSDTLKSSIDEDIKNKKDINGICFITHIDDNVNSMRRAVDLIKEQVKGNAVILSTTANNLSDQVFLAIGVTLDLCAKGLDAAGLIKEVALEIGGSGGGRKDFAQAGGNNPANYNNAVQKLEGIIGKLKIN